MCELTDGRQVFGGKCAVFELRHHTAPLQGSGSSIAIVHGALSDRNRMDGHEIVSSTAIMYPKETRPPIYRNFTQTGQRQGSAAPCVCKIFTIAITCWSQTIRSDRFPTSFFKQPTVNKRAILEIAGWAHLETQVAVTHLKCLFCTTRSRAYITKKLPCEDGLLA